MLTSFVFYQNLYSQANSLLERLLVRLSMAQSVQQRRKLAFCIGQLKINEKGVKRIVDLFK
jgi:hypothetical protein